ncbi:type IV pilus modification PilV family protein [Jeongeupia naejangsanensis]|uniref:Prepilin-type N-terminal cleavage/methylation domain-containing protein n=1 Tax=Jeongeupia naejangsanensis TaxID=613195 RepID=A0ABS2BGU7_9NEIS|nr:prepilin-type N-terminal cleavage/methylation domain-containing protein [Jeongeupia naejangsanensis]MBM3114685.1 prepilin-type N-terminal cleavage/methylation domain-containing protein [Jeongeupia naejangsanensis]
MRKQYGVGLIEVLVALLVIGSGLLAISRFQGTLIENASFTKQRSEAMTYAVQLVEGLRNLPSCITPTPAPGTPMPASGFCVGTAYANIELADNNACDLSATSGVSACYGDAAALSGSGTSYARRWKITNVAIAGTVYSKQLDVRIDWTDNRGDLQQTLLSTVISANR